VADYNGDIISIIPARGGSKGVPRKNIRRLAGKPLIAHTIAASLRARQVKRTFVSTDDDEIAGVARRYGAEVIRRPAALATDTAGSEAALLHALTFLEETEGYRPALVVFLQATSPLRQPDDIDNAIATLQDSGADSLFSACPSHGFYWQRRDGRLVAANYDYRHRPRRQDCPPEYIENGSIYVTRTEILKRERNRLGGRIAVYEMGQLESFQIDTEADFRLMETLFRRRQRQIKETETIGIGV
jgi:CMP-N,N'-diacetyllegionaminic acid synthase